MDKQFFETLASRHGITPEIAKQVYLDICKEMAARLIANEKQSCPYFVIKPVSRPERQKTLQDGSQRQHAMEALQKAAERKAIRVEAAWRIRLDAAQAINVRDLITIFTRLVLLIEDEIGPAQAKGVVDRIDRELLGGALSGSPEAASRTLASRKRL